LLDIISLTFHREQKLLKPYQKKNFTSKIVRGMGFEPTNAYAAFLKERTSTRPDLESGALSQLLTHLFLVSYWPGLATPADPQNGLEVMI